MFEIEDGYRAMKSSDKATPPEGEEKGMSGWRINRQVRDITGWYLHTKPDSGC